MFEKIKYSQEIANVLSIKFPVKVESTKLELAKICNLQTSQKSLYAKLSALKVH